MKQLKLAVFALLGCLGTIQAKLKINNVEVTNSNEHYLEYVRHMTVPDGSNFGSVWDAGNDISGKTPAEVQVIVDAIKALETDSIRKEIYERMTGAPNEWHTFTNTTHARNVVTQRLQTIACMRRFNTNKEYWYASPAKGVPYGTTSPFWELGKGRYPFFFKQKQGTASDAIVSIASGSGGSTTKGECLGAIYACIWYGAYQGMGANAFNALYPGNQALDMNHNKSNTYYRNQSVAVDQGIAHQVPGDKLYLKNHNYSDVLNVDKFWKKGNNGGPGWLDQGKNYVWQGENAVYLGGGKYSGLGLDNLTYGEMREQLRLAYNRDFAVVVANNGQVNGVPVTLMTKEQSEQFIQWQSINRIKH